MKLVALDFDGVLCDSASETAETAWRAGGAIWPDWRDRPVPEEHVARFRRLRPVLETGYQSIPLMRLAVTEPDEARTLAAFPDLCEQILAQAGMTRQQSINLFGATRDAWIRDDLPGWLGRHAFYPGTIQALQALRRQARVIILTTKQERFVQALLKGQAVELPPEAIFGLERGFKKEELLERFLAEPEVDKADCHFVEDRLETLQRVLTRPRLAPLNLYLAEWGYVTDSERKRARTCDRIRVIGLDDLAAI